MKSQYLAPYKTHVMECLNKSVKPLSIGTFVVYRLKGRAKSWTGRYIRSLRNGLEKDDWVVCSSRLNGIAYKPKML
jgi:hypothetical protein